MKAHSFEEKRDSLNAACGQEFKRICRLPGVRNVALCDSESEGTRVVVRLQPGAEVPLSQLPRTVEGLPVAVEAIRTPS